MKIINVFDLIGKPLINDDIIALLSMLKIDPKSVKLKRGDISVIIENVKQGVQLTFKTLEEIEDELMDPDIEMTNVLSNTLEVMRDYTEGMLFLSDIYFNDIKKHVAVHSILPNGINFDATQEGVYNILGKPDIENTDDMFAQWFYDYYKLSVGFYRNDKIFSIWLYFMENSHLMDDSF